MNYIFGAVSVFLATIISQVFNILTLPYLSREYDKYSLAALGIISSSLSVLTIFSSFRLEFFIVKEKSEALLMYVRNLYFVTFFAGLLYAIPLWWYLKFKEITFPEYCIPLIFAYLVGAFWNNIAAFSSTARSAFFELSYFKLARVFIFLLFLFVFSDFERVGILLALLLSTVMTMVVYFLFNTKEIIGIFKSVSLSVQFILIEIKGNYRATIQATLNVINLQFLAIYVAVFESSHMIASYFFMERMLNAPLNLLSASLRQIIYKYFVENSQSFLLLIKSMLLIQLLLLLVAIFFNIIIVYFGNNLVLVVLGDGWGDVVNLIDVYIVIVVMQIVNIPVTSMYLAIDKISILGNYEKFDLIVKIVIALYSIIADLELLNFIGVCSIYITCYYVFISTYLYRFLYSECGRAL